MKFNQNNRQNEKNQLYDPLFHDGRFKIVEEHLSPENAKKFRKLSNEDKSLFINILLEKGVLSW